MIEPFPRRGGELHCGDLPVTRLVRRYGTPLYLYDATVLDDRLGAFRDAFVELELFLAYSVKANGNLAILDRVARRGAGADIVSGGELYRALRAGIPAERIVFAGVGKTASELRRALEAGVRAIHVESEGELRVVRSVAADLGRTAPVAIRINPDLRAPTPHEYTRTGHATSKFGVPVERALELYRRARDAGTTDPRGIAVHIGSQVAEVDPYVRALDRTLEVVERLRGMGIEPRYLDLGGGFGVPGPEHERLDLDALAREVVPRIRSAGLSLILEPGRAVVGEAGVLVTRVLYVKEQGGKTFVVTDAGMTELLRPSHYGVAHEVVPVSAPGKRERRAVDVVGPVCETGDFLARDLELPLPRPGELLAVRTAGAYAFAMATNYNGRPRPAEVLVDGDEAHLVRRREVHRDLVRGETIPGAAGDGVAPGAGAPAKGAADGSGARTSPAGGER